MVGRTQLPSLQGSLQRARMPTGLSSTFPSQGFHLTAARSAVKKEVVGAPFTNSITLSPVSTASAGSAASAAPAASASAPPQQFFKLSCSIPSLPTTELLFPLEQTADAVSQQLAKALGVSEVSIFLNGKRMAPSLPLTSALGGVLDVAVEGIFYAVNTGLKLSTAGAVAKPSLLRTYALVGAGGVLMLVAALQFWRVVLPPENQKKL